MRDITLQSSNISFTSPNNSSFNLTTNASGNLILNFSSLTGSNVYEVMVRVGEIYDVYGLFLVYLFNGTTLSVLLSGGNGVGSSISGLNLTITTSAIVTPINVSINKF